MSNQKYSTPVGTAVYPALKNPDTKFDELGVYKADLSVPTADAEPLMNMLSDIFKKVTGKAPKKADNPMWEFETDESGEETGNVIFKFRAKNRISKKTGEVWDRRPKQFDASLRPIDENPWGGSKMVVSFEVYEWSFGGKTGVKLIPVAVQIIELKTGSGPDASSYGFGVTEGFTASDDSLTSYDDDDEDDGPKQYDDGDEIPDGADY